MGYYTKFVLIADDMEKLDQIMEQIYEESGQENFENLDKCSDGSYRCENKWYEHEVEMVELSRKNPTVLFTMTGHGEDTGDLWRHYYLNGLVQNAEMRFDDYDPAKLSEYKK